MKYTKDIRFMGTIEIKCLKKSRQAIDSSLLTEDMVSSAVDVNKVLNLGKAEEYEFKCDTSEFKLMVTRKKYNKVTIACNDACYENIAYILYPIAAIYPDCKVKFISSIKDARRVTTVKTVTAPSIKFIKDKRKFNKTIIDTSVAFMVTDKITGLPKRNYTIIPYNYDELEIDNNDKSDK